MYEHKNGKKKSHLNINPTTCTFYFENLDNFAPT